MHALLMLALSPLMSAGPADAIASPKVAEEVEEWRLAAPVQSFDAKTIFEYMDGAAEPYLDYAFRRLHVAFYQAGPSRFAVEMYDMTRGPEAFGIFSNWLDGEEVKVGQRGRLMPGQVSFWQGDYYTKVYRLKGPDVSRARLIELARATDRALGKNGERPRRSPRSPATP